MKRFEDRCRELREEHQPRLQSRMIFLLRKDTSVLEAIVAWTTLDTHPPVGLMVDDNATMSDLWGRCSIDLSAFATALGCTLKDALPRFNQLVQLEIIYPDGSVAELAMSIVNTYITVQVGDLRKRREKTQP